MSPVALWRRKRTSSPYAVNALLLGDGMYSRQLDLVDVVGESFYQEAISSVSGRTGTEALSFDCVAALVPEPTNPHDPNAIAVQIEGHLVGHLSRENAILYHPVVDAGIRLGIVLACNAHIAAHDPADATTPNAGVFLHLPSPQDAAHELAEWSREKFA
jgi:HIRAN domain